MTKTSLTLFDNTNIHLPQRVDFEGASESGDICIRFLRHLEITQAKTPEHKILSSIQFAADILGYSEEHVSKTLTDLGLRAPRGAYPSSYLNFAQDSLERSLWQTGSPNEPLQQLAAYWQSRGEALNLPTLKAAAPPSAPEPLKTAC